MLGIALVYALLVAFLGVVAYFHLFSTFSDYDDEGYLLITIRHLLHGYRLYDDVPTPYGPFYFLCRRFIHGTLAAPLSTDAVRFGAMAGWLAVACICSAIVQRLTRSWIIAATTLLMTFLHLRAFSNEPGHPQELAALLVALGIALPVFARGQTTKARLALLTGLGAVCAASFLVKANVGVFMTLAVLLAAALVMQRGRARGVAIAALAAAALALPWALMARGLGGQFGRVYLGFSVVVSLSVLAVVLVALRRRGELRFAHLLAFAAGAALLTAAICLRVLLDGTTLRGMYDGIIDRPRRITTFGWPPPFNGYAPVWALLGVVASALYLPWFLRAAPGRRGFLETAAVVMKLALAACILIAAKWDRPALDMSFALPFLWLALLPPSADDLPARDYFARLVMVCVAALQPLQAYPVSGSQLSFGTFVMVPLAGVCIGDALQWSRTTAANREVWPQALAALLLVGAVLTCGRMLGVVARRYQTGVSLGFPGAQRVRLPERQVAVYRLLVATLRDDCDTFLATTGSNSLYLWTGKEPPNRLVLGDFIDFFSPDEQHFMVRSVLEHPNGFIVRHPGFFGPSPTTAFGHDVEQQFQVWRRIGSFEVMVPNGSRDSGISITSTHVGGG